MFLYIKSFHCWGSHTRSTCFKLTEHQGLTAAVGNSGRTDCADSDSDAVSWTFPHYFIVRSRELLCVRFHFAYLYVSVWIKVNSSVSSHIQTHSGCGLTPEIFSLHLQRRVNREKGEKKEGTSLRRTEAGSGDSVHI